nr:reverse transcriptase domain-containing protein [Tanacetum cinerariifolium]
MRLENQSKAKERARWDKSKTRGKRPEYQETSSDTEYEEGSDDTCEDLNSPYKRPKPTPFTPRITRFKYHRRAKLPMNIKVYEGNKDPEDHLSIFSAAVEQEGWPMPIWCKILCQTLGGAARNWFDDLDPKTFMHGHGHPELAKKLKDKIPKMVDEMFERVRAFIRGKVVASSAKMPQPPQWDKGNTRPVWSGGQDKSRNRNIPREIEELVASRKLAHLVKDIRRSNQRNGNRGRNGVKVINMMNDWRNRKRPNEGEGSGLTEELTFRNSLTDEPIILEGMIEGETYHPLGVIDLRITIWEVGRNKTVPMEFAIVRCRYPYNVLIGRTRMRSLGVVGSTIHSMIKFPTDLGVITMET